MFCGTALKVNEITEMSVKKHELQNGQGKIFTRVCAQQEKNKGEKIWLLNLVIQVDNEMKKKQCRENRDKDGTGYVT